MSKNYCITGGISYLCILCQPIILKEVIEASFATADHHRSVLEQKDRQDRKYDDNADQYLYGLGNASGTADTYTEAVNNVSERHVCVQCIGQLTGDLDRICTGGTCQLQYHEYQHQEAADFTKGNVGEILH